MIFFQVITDGALMKPLNLTNLVLQNSYVVILALGMLLVIVAGNIDLSVGSVAALTGAVAAVLIVNYDMNFAVAMVICLLIGAAIGTMQGYFVAYIKIPAFIVTLAGMLIFRGLTLVLLVGQSIGPFPPEFQALGSGFIPDFFGGDGLHMTSLVIGAIISALLVFLDLLACPAESEEVRLSGQSVPFLPAQEPDHRWRDYGSEFHPLASYNGLPNVLIVLGLLIALYGFVTNRTVIGRRHLCAGRQPRRRRSSPASTPNG